MAIKVDIGIGSELDSAAECARHAEAMNFAGVSTTETAHDPFFPLLLAAQSTSRVELTSSIAVAFARTPMILANIGHDLNATSKGRFVLGLGSQIKPHVAKRFSMPWSAPAARMKEYIQAMRAIWAAWHEGKPLEFAGQYYTHTLMTPMFTPTNVEYGAPRVFLAAVGPKMTEVAAEVADGMIVHAFTTRKYLQETTLPALERGFAAAGRSRADFEISYPVFVVTGDTEEQMEKNRAAVAKQIAFYGSTPAYKPVLDSIGAGELQRDLNWLSKQGRWDDMATLITSDLMQEFAVTGEPADAARQIKARYDGLIDRTTNAYSKLSLDGSQKFVDALTA